MPAEPDVLNGRYRLVYKLGAGAMGSVWLAEDLLLERSVALKELVQRAGPADLSERRTRALYEARAMARVRHPAIVPIHDVFFIDDDPWIVMEYISGRSLHDIINGQTLDERSIARIGVHVLRGLTAVHRAGVVHRDVKPTNILVADDNSIFLVDFGIARIAGDVSLTGQSIVGTPEFLAPERFRPGYKVGPPADIWALGVTFYHALEGYSPFRRDSDRAWEATMMAILKEAPLPPARRGRLADITLRMLDKDPARRVDAAEVLGVLESIAIGEPDPPRRAESAHPGDGGQPFIPSQPGGPHGRSAPLVRPIAPSPRRAALAPWPGNGQAGDGRRPRFDDAREMIRNVGTDTGVAMLLAMAEDDAARILADCPARLCGELLQGIAAVRPATASAILRMLRSTAAGRAFAYLRPETAASLVSAMPPAEALRILDNTDERTAAGVIMELAVPVSANLLKSMYSRQRAADVLTHVRPVTAAELLRSDAEFATAVLRHLSEPVRKQVSRHMSPGA
jgi:eukaryotic-like serine/threonine-protein kinase